MTSIRNVLWSSALVLTSGLFIAAFVGQPSTATADLAPNTFTGISVAATALSTAAELRADRLDRGQTSKADMLVAVRTSTPSIVADPDKRDLESVGGAPVKLASWLVTSNSLEATTSGPIDLTASFKETRLGTDVTIAAARRSLDGNNVAISGSGAMTESSGLSGSSLGGRASSGSAVGRSAGAVGGIRGAVGL